MTTSTTHSFPFRPLDFAALLALLSIGLALRGFHLNAPPEDFALARQYNTLLLARAYYFEANPDVAVEYREAAAAHVRHVQRAEPPLLERAAAALYRLRGGESFAVIRILPIAAWLIGTLPLYALGRRLSGRRMPALIATAFYLWSPYGVTASRSLQPDAAMVAALLVALWTVVRYAESPTATRLAVATVVSALATWIKPGVVLFAVCGVFLALRWARESGESRDDRSGGFPRHVSALLRDAHCWIFAAGTALPSVIYLFVSNIGADTGSVLASNMVPQWYGTLYFWKGWFVCLGRVMGMPGLGLGAIGLLLALRGEGRPFFLGYGLGYFAICLLSSYTTPSHDYWHLQALPLFALGLGMVLTPSADALLRRAPVWQRAGSVAIVLLVVAATALDRWKSVQDRPSDLPALAAEIGDLVGHSPRTILLDYVYGRPLMYFGHLSGRSWPDAMDLWAESLHGETLPAAERFERQYARDAPQFFIACRNLRDFHAQADLKEFLGRHAVILRETPRYIVYRFTEIPDGAQ